MNPSDVLELFKGEKKWAYYVWILLIMAIWFYWWMFLDVNLDCSEIDNYTFPVIVGFAAGIFSGLSPVQTFKAGFLGFNFIMLIFGLLALFDIGASLGFILYMVLSHSIFAVFCGLFGMKGAIVRRLLLRKKTDVHLESWQWVLLIGGLTTFANVFYFLSVVFRFPYQLDNFWTYLAPDFLTVLPGLFVLGLFIGAVWDLPYQNLIRIILRIMGICHASYLGLFAVTVILEGTILWTDVLPPLFCLIFTGLVLLGVHLGYRLKT